MMQFKEMLFSYPRISYGVLLFTVLASLLSCEDNDEEEDVLDGNWTEIAEPAASVRSGSVFFVINDKGYFGLGYNGTSGSSAKGYKADFWGYNGNTWTDDLPAFPGTLREKAVAFVLDNKVYVGLGYNNDLADALGDFWQYDPNTLQWTQIGDFPFALYNAFAFVVDGRAFVGTGRKNDGSWENRIWEFDKTNLSWNSSPYTTIPSNTREGAFAFVVNSTAYIGGGYSNGNYRTQLFAFTPANDAEMQEISLDDEDNDDYYDEFVAAVSRTNAVTVVLNGKAYFIMGSAGSSLSTIYEYDPGTGVWAQKTSFEGAPRTNAAGFVLNDRIIVGSGNNSSNYFSDFWEFKPLEEYDEND